MKGKEGCWFGRTDRQTNGGWLACISTRGMRWKSHFEYSVNGSARCRSSLSSVRLDSGARSSVKRPGCEKKGEGKMKEEAWV